MSLIASVFSIGFSGVTVNSTDNTSSVVFNTGINMNSLVIGEDYVYLDTFAIPNCYGSYDLNVTNEILKTSTLYSLFDCAQTQNDTDVGNIVLLMFTLFVIMALTSQFVMPEHMKYIVWIFIAVVMLIALSLGFAV